ncbi:MAG: DUF72 domain-containing protein [Proteobacteria bacterium]|nr:DUF72 domain-containing protein [Pseudomonadota bacterium]
MDRTKEAIRIGIGGWVYEPWRGRFYPKGWQQRRELEYASRHVTSIEINSTYYAAQKPETYARWRDAVPDDFIFSAKAPKRITQSRRLASTGGQIDAFLGDLAHLRNRLGPVVWQLDRNAQVDRDDFTAFLDLIPDTLDGRRLRHVLDVRDAAFVNAGYVALARARGMAIVHTDSPDLPQIADLSGDFVYARLMRSRAWIETGYPDEELAAWASLAQRWVKGEDPAELPHVSPVAAPMQPREVFLYFISAAKERNPASAMALMSRLGIDAPGM